MKKFIRIIALVLALLCVLPLSAFAAKNSPKEYSTMYKIGSCIISDYERFTKIASELRDEERDELLSLYSEEFFNEKSLAMPEIMVPDTSWSITVESCKIDGNVLTLTVDGKKVSSMALCVICHSHFFIPVPKNVTEMYVFNTSSYEVECETLPMPSVTLSFNEVEMICGDTAQLLHSVMNAYEYGFSSSDTSVATVDEGGKITAVGEGETTIIFKAENIAGSATAECKVTVRLTFWQKVERFFNRVEAFFQKIISLLFK